MKVGSIVCYDLNPLAKPLFWRINSICLGVLGQESIIEIESLSKGPGYDIDGNYHHMLWVPIQFVEYLKMYTLDNRP